MPFEASLLYILLGAVAAAVVVYYALPKIELRGHSETHNGIRVREVAFTWFRGRSKPSDKPSDTSKRPHWLECVVYVTLKTSSP